jgi:hypothetical protein
MPSRASPRPDRILPEIYPFLWRDRQSPHPAVETRSIPVDTSGRDRLHIAQSRTDHRSSPAATRFHLGLRCRLQRVRHGHWGDPASGCRADCLLQSADRAPSLEARRIRAGVDRARQGRPPLETLSLAARVHHPDKSLILKYLLDQRPSTIPQHNWVSKLCGYHFMVEFKSGKQNAAADALSHRDEEPPMMFTLSLPGFELYGHLRGEATILQDFVDKRATITAGTASPG